MKRRMALLLVLAMTAGILSGCALFERNPEIFNNKSDSSQKKKSEELPDTITLAIENAAGLNPYELQPAGNLQVLRLLYEPLFSYDENMKAVPVLAEGCTVSEGGLKATVKIKDGIRWHDGSKFTAYDVLNAVKLIINGETPYSRGVIQKAELKDNSTIEFTFTRPQVSVEEQLMFPLIKAEGNSILGTGAYKYAGKENTDTFVLSLFEEYHDEKPYIKKVRIINAPDFEAVGQLFEIGETDILVSDAFDYAAFNVKSDMNVCEYTVNKLVYAGINFEKTIFWGESTRLALNYIIDKNEIVDKVMYKKATAANFPINPQSWLYPAAIDTKKDTRYAEELMLNDSWTRIDGTYVRMIDNKRQEYDIDILVPDDKELVAVAEIIKKNLNNFGIKADVLIKSEEEFNASVANGAYDLFINRTELPACADFEELTGNGNIFGYLNSELNVLTESIRVNRNEEELKRLYEEACSMLLKDMQFVTLFFYKDAMVTGQNISENAICGGDNPFYNISEWNRP